MSYFSIQPATTVTAATMKDLLAAWNLFGHTGLVETFVCEAPLTKARLRRLPSELRRKIRVPDDGLAFLERLWDLDDKRY